MVRVMMIVTILVGLACLAGCPGSSKTGPQKQADAGLDGGHKVYPSPNTKLDGGVPEGFIDPLTAARKIQDPIKLAKKMNEIAQELESGDAPEYAKKMVDHLEQVTTRIADNLDDCDKVQDALEAYFEEHKAEIVRLHKEGTELEAKMDENQKAKVQTQTMLLMGPIAESLAKTLARFQIKCPEQAQAVADLLQAVVGT